MEIENTENIETIETPEIETQTEAADPMETPEVPEYTPSYKFKVGDQEHEFDERVKGSIKSKEDEDYFRDLHTKAYGLDVVKARQEEKEKKWTEEKNEYSQLKNTHERVLNNLSKYNDLKSKDFALFQKAWEIPDGSILERAKQILAVHGNPDAEAQARSSLENRWNLIQQEDRITHETSVQAQMQRQLHEMKMTQAMATPDITRFASEFDKKMGPGSFQEEVNRLGSLEYHAGRYLDPQVAVQQAHQRLSRLFSIEAQAPASAPTVAPAKTTVPPPALPNIGSGRSGTSTTRKIKSIADLKKLAQTME